MSDRTRSEPAVAAPVERDLARTQSARSPAPAQVGVPALLALSGTAGNAAVAALVAQRQTPMPAGPVSPPAPAPPTVAPTTTPKKLPPGQKSYSGPRFDLDYTVVDPPAVGVVTVTLKVHIEFKDFDRSMLRRKEFAGHRWTPKQLSDMKWPPEERKTWAARFSKAVGDGWSSKKLQFQLQDPAYEPYRARCVVTTQTVDKPEDANTRITAQWVPRDAPRLRSSVDGRTAELDARDVDQDETHKVRPSQIVHQVPGFEHDSAAITPAVESGIGGFTAEFRRQRGTGGQLAVPDADIDLRVIGRSTRRGATAHNQDLGQQRAAAVATRLRADLSMPQTKAFSRGEKNASDEEHFRRIDIFATTGDTKSVTQNVAAHEAGHMFGLDDEYLDEAPEEGFGKPRFPGDRPGHDADVRATLGDKAADELMVQPSNSPSIMSTGSEVRAGHYVYFVQKLNEITDVSWTVA